MQAQNKIYEYLKTKKRMCSKDIQVYLETSRQRSNYIFNQLSKLNDVEVQHVVEVINNRKMLIKYIKRMKKNK